MGIEQGDPALLDTEVAQRLLGSTIPARVAYTGLDGTPRLVSSWHHWTGEELVMATYLACPPMGITRPAHRVAALRANPSVAVSIDTDSQPPEVLLLRGPVTITEVNGMVAEQALAAHRFLGAEGGAQYASMGDDPATRMARIALRPTWVGVLNFTDRAPAVMGG